MKAHSIRDVQVRCLACRDDVAKVVSKQNIDPAKRTAVWRCEGCGAEWALTAEEARQL